LCWHTVNLGESNKTFSRNVVHLNTNIYFCPRKITDVPVSRHAIKKQSITRAKILLILTPIAKVEADQVVTDSCRDRIDISTTSPLVIKFELVRNITDAAAIIDIIIINVTPARHQFPVDSHTTLYVNGIVKIDTN
jgi:hypothetical protein